MKSTIRAGLTQDLSFTVTNAKTVPALYPESAQFAGMPAVFATGFMVGLFEWACMELLAPHLEEGEGSLGVGVEFTHLAATPPGLTVLVRAELTGIEGRNLEFKVEGHDGLDVIGGGTHRRAVVRFDKFAQRTAEKLERARSQNLLR